MDLMYNVLTMDIDYQIEKELVFINEIENKKDKAKKRRKILGLAEDNLRKIIIERISGRAGDC